MKTATLTLPLHVNYGAMLQAYALHKAIESLGKEPILLDIRPSIYKNNFVIGLASYLKSKIKQIVSSSSEYGNVEFEIFSEKYLNKSKKIRFQYQLRNYCNYSSYIVGSDQVWRSEYALNIGLFYFDFLPNHKKRSSYAASFGKSDWSYSNNQRETCKKLIDKFELVSVREKSAVELVNKNLCKDAVHVIDPTMIIDPQYYNDLIEIGSKNNFSKNHLFSYVLDITDEKEYIISTLSNELNLTKHVCNEGLEDSKKMSIEDWLQGIRDSRFIVTDSFHGMVFCLIFKKDFIVLANNHRGYERFSSLLSDLGLMDRLVSEADLSRFQFTELESIDYELVGSNLAKLKEYSLDILEKII